MKVLPSEIEKKSFEIITKELQGRKFPKGQEEIVKRVIHTTADFDYADNLYFSNEVVSIAKQALCNQATIITDTQMALSGINKKALEQLGCHAHCFMSDPQVAKEAKQRGITRAMVSMEYAIQTCTNPLIFVIGNAPTALLHLYELVEQEKCNPAFVVGAPVGFVNVIESKEIWIDSKVPCMIARGRKGGSNVAAAIVNALLYQIVEREGF